MKKTLSILLAVLLAFSSLFCVAGFADGGTKSEAFLNSLVTKKSVTVTLDDSTFTQINLQSPLKIKNVSLSAQFDKNNAESYDIKIGGSAKIGPFKAKIVGDNTSLAAYFLFFKIDVAKILNMTDSEGYTGVVNELLAEISPYLDLINADTLNYLKYDKTYTESQLLNGKVEVERFVPNIRKIAEALVAASDEQIDISQMSDEELLALVLNTESEDAAMLKELANMYLEFVYKDGVLINIRATDKDNSQKLFNLSDDFKDVKFKSIESPAKDSAFKSQFFAIDLTGMFTNILGGLIG